MSNGDMYNDLIRDIAVRQVAYDEETKKQLDEVRNSDWHSTKYLREILWELRYARRKANRP